MPASWWFFGFVEVFMGREMYFRTLLKNFLDLKGIPYQHLRHAPAFRAGQLAAVENVPGDLVAKTVIVKADGEFAMAVLPASRRVKVPTLRDSLCARHLRLATELEFQTLFPDSDVGAMSPFGNLYELRICRGVSSPRRADPVPCWDSRRRYSDEI